MNFSILDPTGNITAIVTEQVLEGLRASFAEEIMKAEPSVEQVGFLLPGDGIYDAKLMMAGGEFCGNASMSAAAMTAMRNGAKSEEKLLVTLCVSGNPDPVKVELECINEKTFKGRVAMPRAIKVIDIELPLEDSIKVPVVIMPGIAHAIVPDTVSIEEIERHLPGLCKELEMDAMGVMLINEAQTSITPVVYVPGANTLVREHSCASGTAAVGSYLASVKGESVRIGFFEPGGTLTVEADVSGALFIEGTVALVKQV